MAIPIPEKGRIQEQIKEALLAGITPQQLFEAGFAPGSIGHLVYRLSSQHLVKRPPGFVGWYQRSRRGYILRRDNYTCRKCGAFGPNVELQLHHRDHNKKNNGSFNLVTWCKECNWSEGAKWAKLLREKRPKKKNGDMVRAAEVKQDEKERRSRLQVEWNAARIEDRRIKVEEARAHKETAKMLSRMSSFVGQLARSFR